MRVVLFGKLGCKFRIKKKMIRISRRENDFVKEVFVKNGRELSYG